MIQRPAGWPLTTLCLVYRETWDPVLLQTARRIVDYARRCQDPERGAWDAQVGHERPYRGGCVFAYTLLRGLRLFADIASEARARQDYVSAARWIMCELWRPRHRYLYEQCPLHEPGARVPFILGEMAGYGTRLSGDPMFAAIGHDAFLMHTAAGKDSPLTSRATRSQWGNGILQQVPRMLWDWRRTGLYTDEQITLAAAARVAKVPIQSPGIVKLLLRNGTDTPLGNIRPSCMIRGDWQASVSHCPKRVPARETAEIRLSCQAPPPVAQYELQNDLAFVHVLVRSRHGDQELVTLGHARVEIAEPLEVEAPPSVALKPGCGTTIEIAVTDGVDRAPAVTVFVATDLIGERYLGPQSEREVEPLMRDDALLQQYAATQDPDAFAQLVERYSDFVYTTCLRITHDAHDTQDAAQECFLSLARKAGSIHSSLAGWLHSTARRASLAMVKKSRKREERKATMAVTDRNDDQPSWRDLEPHIDAAVQDLPPELRSPVVLHYLQGKPQSEVGEIMGVDRSTVSRRLKRGVAELRQCLEKAGMGLSVAALASCLGQSSLEAAPIALKMALAGVGTTAGAAVSMSAGSATTPSTSAVLGTLHGKFAIGAAITILVAAGAVVHKELKKPRPPQAAKTQSGDGWARNGSGGSNARNWRKRFEDVYALAAGEVVKRIAPPFIPERAEHHKDFGWDEPFPSTSWFHFDGRELRDSAIKLRAPNDLGVAIRIGLKLRSYEYDFPADLLRMQLPGDWIVRSTASQRAKLNALAQILRSDFGKAVRFDQQQVEREVIVARGIFKYQPLPGVKSHKRDSVYIADDPQADEWAMEGTGPLEDLLGAMGDLVRMPVIDLTERPGPGLTAWAARPVPSGPSGPVKLEKLLDNVAQQTGLSFELERRSVSVWRVAETSEEIVVTGLELHVVDPEQQAEDFRYTYAYSQDMSFTPLGIDILIDQDILMDMVVFGDKGHVVLVRDDRIDIHLDGDGEVDLQATWPVQPGTTFRQVKRFEFAYRGGTVSVPVLLDLVRGRGGKPLGEFHTNATLTGDVRLDRGPPRLFAIAHLDPQLTTSAATRKPRLIIDTNGDGTLDWRHDSAEHFDMGEPFRIEGKAYSLIAYDGRAGTARFRRLP